MRRGGLRHADRRRRLRRAVAKTGSIGGRLRARGITGDHKAGAGLMSIDGHFRRASARTGGASSLEDPRWLCGRSDKAERTRPAVGASSPGARRGRGNGRNCRATYRRPETCECDAGRSRSAAGGGLTLKAADPRAVRTRQGEIPQRRQHRSGGRGSDQGEHRIRELLPNSQIRRLNCEPAKPEHVSARFGYVTDLLPAEFSDPQSYFPSADCTRSGEETRNPAPRPTASRAPFIRISKTSSCKANVAKAIFILSRSWIRASSG